VTPLGPRTLPPRSILSWNRLLVQSSAPGRYRGYGFRDPISPSAFPRPYGLPKPRAAGCLFKRPIATLFEFRLPPECFPVPPSRSGRRNDRFSNSPGLRFPSAHPRLGGPLVAGLPRPLRFAFRVFSTLLTVYSPRVRAGPVSCRQRSWDLTLRSVPLSKGTPDVSARDEPTCRFTCRYSLGRILGPDRQAPAPGL